MMSRTEVQPQAGGDDGRDGRSPRHRLPGRLLFVHHSQLEMPASSMPSPSSHALHLHPPLPVDQCTPSYLSRHHKSRLKTLKRPARTSSSALDLSSRAWPWPYSRQPHPGHSWRSNHPSSTSVASRVKMPKSCDACWRSGNPGVEMALPSQPSFLKTQHVRAPSLHQVIHPTADPPGRKLRLDLVEGHARGSSTAGQTGSPALPITQSTDGRGRRAQHLCRALPETGSKAFGEELLSACTMPHFSRLLDTHAWRLYKWHCGGQAATACVGTSLNHKLQTTIACSAKRAIVTGNRYSVPMFTRHKPSARNPTAH